MSFTYEREMPNYNYYKTISANLLVTSHDLNFLMSYIKENEIYNHKHGVSGDFYYHYLPISVIHLPPRDIILIHISHFSTVKTIAE
jgi:hypothetical protein